MNKEQFKNLDILAQIEYVNNILKEGKTLTAFSEEVEISRKTISKNFSKFGYKYSQSKKQYILANLCGQRAGTRIAGFFDRLRPLQFLQHRIQDGAERLLRRGRRELFLRAAAIHLADRAHRVGLAA